MDNKVIVKTSFNTDIIKNEIIFPEVLKSNKFIYDTADMIIDLRTKGIEEALFKLGYSKMEWINVRDRLPEKNGRYLVFYKINYDEYVQDIHSYHCGEYDNCGWMKNAQTRNREVTHWMPLPEPLKEDK